MEQTVRDYIKTYNICQRMKALQYKPYELLVPLLQPERLQQDIIIDFITELLSLKCRQKAYNAILVVVD